MDLRSFSRNYKDWLKICLLAAGFLILASLTAQYIVSHNAWQNSDFFTFWAAGKLVVSGHNPYDQVEWLAVHRAAGSTWFPNPALVYPLPAALLFVPLAKLPLPQAAFVWLVISQFLVLGAVLLTVTAMKWKRATIYIPFIVLGVFFFRPTLITMINGQLSSLLLFATAAAVFFWSRGQWFWGGMLIGLVALKPTAAIVFLPAVGIWLLWRHKWRGLVGIGVILFLLWGMGAFVQLNWLAEWISIGQSKVSQTLSSTFSPTIWGWVAMSTHTAPHWPLFAGGIAAGVILLGLWITRRASYSDQWLLMLGVVMPIALMAAPYIWNYDQVMLIAPILAMTALLDQANAPFAVVALTPIMVDLAAVALLLLAVSLGHDAWGWLLPMTVAVIFGGVYGYTRRYSERPLINRQLE